MTLSRALPIVLALAVLPLAPAAAQFGGMPGMPGAPGMPSSPGMPGAPGMPGMPGAGFGAPQAPPPACQQLLTYRDETQKHGQALQAAGQKKVPPEELCKLFTAFLGAETKLLKGLEANSALCGVPADVIKNVKAGHAKASQIGKQVCDVAAQGPRPTGPSLSEALGTTPTVPDSATATKRGQGTFDTLSGSPLAR
jgi:hypothetical protein